MWCQQHKNGRPHVWNVTCPSLSRSYCWKIWDIFLCNFWRKNSPRIVTKRFKVKNRLVFCGRLAAIDVTADNFETSLQPTLASSSAVSTDVSSVDVTSRGYLASSSGDTSGRLYYDVFTYVFLYSGSLIVTVWAMLAWYMLLSHVTVYQSCVETAKQDNTNNAAW